MSPTLENSALEDLHEGPVMCIFNHAANNSVFSPNQECQGQPLSTVQCSGMTREKPGNQIGLYGVISILFGHAMRLLGP